MRKAPDSSMSNPQADSGRVRALNVACGFHTRIGWVNLDFSPALRMKKHPNLVRLLHWLGALSTPRYERIQRLDPDVLCHDVRHGLPFANDYFDVVYHSNFLEHLPRQAALPFLQECHRVTKRGGIIRIAVPDLEMMAERYLSSISVDGTQHEAAVESIFEQIVRQKLVGTSMQKPWVRLIEKTIRGDAAKGERGISGCMIAFH